MRYLYVTGGHQRFRVFKTEREWNLYDKALILRVDTETKTAETQLEYITPPEACAADELPSILFKSGTLCNRELYVCTSTEVLVYELPAFRRTGYVSLPCFNDLHHVYRAPDGHLLVANTGLDMVVEFTLEGRVVSEWNVMGGDPWERFSRETDYRRKASTKPHLSHPNFVFPVGEDYWVTRGRQGDAVCLTRMNRQVKLSSVTPHDGFVCQGRIYFTTVDSTIVIVNQDTMKIEDVVDLKTVDNESRALLGWCRGLLPLSGTLVWVGFTRVRRTKFKENLNWVKNVFHDWEKPTHIALYDLRARKCLKDIDLEPFGMNILFEIFPAEAGG
jgi:hypothetical protein